MAPNNALQKSDVGEEDGSISRGVITAQEVRSRGDGVNKNKPEDESFIMSEIRKFLAAVMFLTRLPCPKWVDHAPVDLVPGMCYSPVIGSLVGIWAAVWFEALQVLFPAYVASILTILAVVWITGCFHEDGLADTLDAFGGGWGAAQILRIMKDSRVGTYAVVGMCLYLHGKVYLIAYLTTFETHSIYAYLIVANTFSRLTSVWLVKTTKYIHDEGDDKGLLYNSFAGCLKAGLLTNIRVFSCTLYSIVVALYFFEPFVAVMLTGMVFFVIVAAGRYGKAVIGGVIGDFLGATIMIQELLIYMSFAANWDLLYVPLMNFNYQGGTVDDFVQFIQLLDWSAWIPIFKLVAMIFLPVLFMRGAGDLPSSC